MNCKPGDLAYLSSDCVDEGVIVQVLCAGPLIDFDPTWRCKSRTPIHCDMRAPADNSFKGDALANEICAPDKYLRPISGVPLSDEVSGGMKESAHTSTTRAHAQEAA